MVECGRVKDESAIESLVKKARTVPGYSNSGIRFNFGLSIVWPRLAPLDYLGIIEADKRRKKRKKEDKGDLKPAVYNE